MLEAGAKIGERRAGRAPVLVHPVQDPGLEPAEAEIELVLLRHRPRQAEGVRIPVAREAFDDGAPGIAEPEKLGDLVECFTRRVIAGAPERTIDAVVEHMDDRRVPARHEERPVRQRRRRTAAEPTAQIDRGEVTF